MDTVHRVLSDGLTLVAETTGEGLPLVFSHGLTNNRLQGRLLLQPLIGAYRLVCFDQRGHGDSTPVTDPACYDPEHMTNDIAAVMDALGIRRATLSGESMGSATALLFALRHPKRVERLLLVAPALADRPNLGSDCIKELGRQLSTAQGVEDYIRDAMAGEWQEAGYTPEAMACQAAYFRSFQPASMAAACQAMAGWVILKSLDELHAITCPVHIIAWEGDLIHPVPLAQAMVDRLSRARLTVVPSAAAISNDPASVGRTFARSQRAQPRARSRGTAW